MLFVYLLGNEEKQGGLGPKVNYSYKRTYEKLKKVNFLSGVGLNGRKPRKKPLLTKMHKEKRLHWAKKHLSWTVDDWEKVLFSDESPFELFQKSRNAWVRRRIGEEFKAECVTPTVKHGGGKIMIWGCFSIHGTGKLKRIIGNMNGAMYREILKTYMTPHMQTLPRGTIFQHDNDPKHRSKIVQKYLEGTKCKVLSWLSQSPDLVFVNVSCLILNCVHFFSLR